MQALVETVASTGDSPAPCDDLQHRERLLRSMHRPGVQIPEYQGLSAADSGGVSHSTSVRAVLDSPAIASQFEQQLLGILGSGGAVTLSLTDLHGQQDSIRALQRFCELVSSLMSRVNCRPAQLGLAMRSHQMPLKAFCVLSNAILGHGPRYVYLDELQMQQHNNPRVSDASDKNWRFLWQQRHAKHGLVPIYGGLVRSACRLLSDEVALTVLPGTGILVPAQTAWLPIELNLAVLFKNVSGQFARARLRAIIANVVNAAERLHDEVQWSCARQRTDAHLHRRLALILSGVGQLAFDKNRDPRALSTLAWLCDIVRLIRDEVRRRSGRLAQSLGPMPAIELADPATALGKGTTREQWRREWQAAVQTCALRHRNLLVMSPCSVLPELTSESVAFCDLLPVIRFADAWCFSTTATMTNWSISEYQQFHRRAWATVQGQGRGCVVAARV